MPEQNSSPGPFDHEIAQLAEQYLQAKNSGASVSIDSLLEQHVHLGEHLRQALEAIDLLAPDSSQDPPPVLGDFQLHHELGRGGMGTVYLATQISLGRLVAVKVLKLAGQPVAAADLFVQEARTVAALRHEHIVPVYTVGRADDWLYFAMALIEVDTADHLGLERAGVPRSRADERKRREKIARWGAQVAETLAYAHQQGVVHGDIKPSNLLIDTRQQVWLTDFGLARQASDYSGGKSVPYRGTPKYMSPEQAAAIAAPVDHRTDIYSLGVTLIYWLTGQSLVGGDQPAESLARLQQDSLEEPRTLLAGYSRDWIAVLEKCVARQPQTRYQSAAELASDLYALAEHRPVSARRQPQIVRRIRAAVSQPNFANTAFIAALATMMLLILGNAARQLYRSYSTVPVQFYSDNGDWLAVTAMIGTNRQLTELIVPHDEVRLPPGDIQLNVSAPYRLSYQRKIKPGSATSQGRLKTYRLDAPQSHRWQMDQVVWYQVLEMGTQADPQQLCLALCDDGLRLCDLQSGKVRWHFGDAELVNWGNAVRGCAATFQPDRCVLVPDVNGNQSSEIVLAHPIQPELLCLDGLTGNQLWRTNLIESAGIPTVDVQTLCPILMQYNQGLSDSSSGLSVVVASHLPTPTTTVERWLMSVDPATGKVRWASKPNTSLTAANTQPIAANPWRLQWGEVEKRPNDFQYHETFHYSNDYWWVRQNSRPENVYDPNIRLGTDRPFVLGTGPDARLYWIDRQEVRVFDINSGDQLIEWSLPAASICAPNLLHIGGNRTLLVTSDNALAQGLEFTAWDLASGQVVWKQKVQGQFERLPQSWLSAPTDLPLSVDLNADGVDEWLVASHVVTPLGRQGLTPPYGSIMVHSGETGQSLWPKPTHVPNMDGLIERCVTVADQDGDGWQDVLLGSRFQGGGVSPGVGCFIDLISGKTGKQIWHSQVHTESNQLTVTPNELVDLRVIEGQRLIAVVIGRGVKGYDIEDARPYSTTFLNLDNGTKETFAPGVRAGHFDSVTWLEHRLVDQAGAGGHRPRPGKLFGWAYPEHRATANEDRMLWRIEDYVFHGYADVNGDRFPEVIGWKRDDQRQEHVLFSGLTGAAGWKRRFDEDLTVQWNDLQQDVDQDGMNDISLFVSMTPHSIAGKAPPAFVEIVSGVTGKTIWKHASEDSGPASLLNEGFREPGKLPLVIYQHAASQQVTCVDLDKRKVAWERSDLQFDLSAQAFWPWNQESAKVWFVIAQSENDGTAYFIDPETGQSIHQLLLGRRGSNVREFSQQLVAPEWIRWAGRDLLAIQTLTQQSISAEGLAESNSTDITFEDTNEPANPRHEYRIDLWLIDPSANVVAHWSESSVQTPSVHNAAARSPQLVKTAAGQELLAVAMATGQGIEFRLLNLDEAASPALVAEQSVVLPVARSATVSSLVLLDCDDDGATDFITISNSGVDCTTAAGKQLWHRGPLPADACVIGPGVRDDKKYLHLQLPPFYELHLAALDARTGQDCPSPPKDTDEDAWNFRNTRHDSLIDFSSDAKSPFISAKLRSGISRARVAAAVVDPRSCRLLPWVVNAKSLLAEWQRLEAGIPWWRIIKLGIGVYLLPVLAVWSCIGRRFTVRHLLFIATTVAIGLSLVLAERSSFPSEQLNSGYVSALLVALEAILYLIVFLLPLWELTRAGWRRRLALGCYTAFLMIIPIYSLGLDSVGEVPTTFVWDKWWYLLWLAILPTGLVLLLFHSLRLVIKSIRGLARGVQSKLIKLRSMDGQAARAAGETHA